MQLPMRSGRSSCRLQAISEQPARHLALWCRRLDFRMAFSAHFTKAGLAGAAGGLPSTGRWPTAVSQSTARQRQTTSPAANA